eukprot:TRINITY_DN851_c0_g1_i6.p2 TRINITY_DN851_c0_g1~~TRINITY_DN851_c0_g1_i6.p2  ORF type:complete len:112 (-),score=14.69 TRINITY_DN851_c0_g1_i6:274-609(-)
MCIRDRYNSLYLFDCNIMLCEIKILQVDQKKKYVMMAQLSYSQKQQLCFVGIIKTIYNRILIELYEITFNLQHLFFQHSNLVIFFFLDLLILNQQIFYYITFFYKLFQLDF